MQVYDESEVKQHDRDISVINKVPCLQGIPTGRTGGAFMCTYKCLTPRSTKARIIYFIV